MPELPEVETIRQDLRAAFKNDAAVSFEIHDPRLMSAQESERIASAISGQRWIGFYRKGKYLWAELQDKSRLVFHLRMTGQLLIGAGPAGRLTIVFASGKVLRFVDQRRFGEVWYLRRGEPWRSRAPLGPDALEELKEADFVRLIKRKTTRIQPLLMDQRAIAGIGNIYAQEALFKAAIRPTRHGNRVTAKEAVLLFQSLQETLRTAIAYRGSTSRNYHDARGQEGRAQMLHAVYRKGGKPCPRCSGTLRATRVGGRGSVFCPQCQK